MRLAYIHLPRFPMQRRVLEQPSLSGKPVVLHEDVRGAQRVRFASGAAMKRGIKPGMTVASASALDPEVVRLRFEPTHEAKALISLGEFLLPLAPGFQLDAPEGLWLDASASHLSATERGWAERVVGAVRGIGLRARCVVGSERFCTQALARWSSELISVVPSRGGSAVPKLPLIALEEGWLGDGAADAFRELGLTSLGEVAGLPAGALVGRFGSMGLLAARLSRGEDDSRFVPDVLPEVIEEDVQLDWPAEQLEPVLFALKRLVDRLCGRLQGRQLAAVRLTVTVGLEGGEPLVVPLMLARASSESRLLIELIRHRLTDLTVQQPITTLHLKVDEASADTGRQLVLGDAPAGEVELEVVMSRLQSALGEDALFSATPVATHRPEDGWTNSPPLPAQRGEGGAERRVRGSDSALAPHPDPLPAAQGEGGTRKWPKRKAKTEQHGTVSLPTLAERPPRLFREPSRLQTELSSTGTLEHVVLAGRRRKVELLAGPERLVGAWWSPDPFTRDYYRLQLEGVGQLWVFRDGKDGAFYAQGVFD
jgi:protein ImuB